MVQDTFTELYGSTVSIVYFLTLHFYAIKRFVSYSITFFEVFCFPIYRLNMPINTIYLRMNLNERILTFQYSQSGKKLFVYFIIPGITTEGIFHSSTLTPVYTIT